MTSFPTVDGAGSARPGPTACRRFAGRIALVTGGGSGIGAATARRLADEGASVLVSDIDPGAAKAVAEEVGGRALPLDGRSEADWNTAVATVDRLDVLHCNVGQHRPAPLHELVPDEFDAIMELSLRSAYLGVRTCLPLLQATSGAVVVTSSIHALLGLPGAPAYAAAKGALVALVRQLAVEYGPGVRVNAVLPGPIRTPAWADPDKAVRHVARTVAGRLGEAEEVASAVAFLASSDASYITGAALPVDGGWHAKGL
ncbi:SDR family NAD(P)-dependent oxidoreductase [Micromonospora mirobrigensis]|uniref:NAD(P)-dependent dehydrogenase, short-chain alcohol dehydrogenase family n=1 Tax=Micromonospora mirobrigensis TaxID=262898 RepID=A0A1C5AKK2_9ACTN|nr:SDR family NAD(P)-dependent oxidoreductase [Micromonospora mirobrigensis]SCF45729.1 NAD(P)-dependent dehydrogenase, short-chain alcohol dehydrogenase family [Micromonospora mirobrigensis]